MVGDDQMIAAKAIAMAESPGGTSSSFSRQFARITVVDCKHRWRNPVVLEASGIVISDPVEFPNQ